MNKSVTGANAYHAGLAAENQVADRYFRNGFQIIHQRWRGKAGEIDIIAQAGEEVVFIEVKKSHTHAQAAQMLWAAQTSRLEAAANEFLATTPCGSLTPVRFDVALVDAIGQIKTIENAFM